MEEARILVVDNESEIRKLIISSLKTLKVHAMEAESGEAAIKLLEREQVDLILLDLMMENKTGFDVLDYLQKHSFDIPVIVLSAIHQELEKVKALKMGADDYVTKPFSLMELAARIEANLRRRRPFQSGRVIECGPFRYDPDIQILTKPDGEVQLSSLEGDLAELFLSNPNHVFTKKELFYKVWKVDKFETNSVNVYINFLRKKLEQDPSKPIHIQTIRGVGYRFVASEER